MSEKTKLSENQERRIAATLKRIREGLDKRTVDHLEEPAHIFEPEIVNEVTK